jgi:tellurite resistance-related uncharacterized protein
MTAPAPYRSTPLFTQDTLPKALRQQHDTKDGVWGVIRVIDGELRLTIIDPPSDTVVRPGSPAVVLPRQPHFVTPIGPMTMQVDFYNQPPLV